MGSLTESSLSILTAPLPPPSPCLSTIDCPNIFEESSSSNTAGPGYESSHGWALAMEKIQAQELKLGQQEIDFNNAREEMAKHESQMKEEYQARFKFLDQVSNLLRGVNEEELCTCLKSLVNSNSSSHPIPAFEISPPPDEVYREHTTKGFRERQAREIAELKEKLKHAAEEQSISKFKLQREKERYRFMTRGHARVALKLVTEKTAWSWKYDKLYKFAKRLMTLTEQNLMSGDEFGGERAKLRAILVSLNGRNGRTTGRRADHTKNKTRASMERLRAGA